MGLGNKLDYLLTADGVLNFFEVCVGCVLLYQLRTGPVVSSGDAGRRHWVAALQLSAFSFTCNAAQLLVAACLSPTTGYLMHHMLYYAVCLASPAATYGAISFALVRQEGTFTPVTMLASLGAGLHFVHLVNVLSENRSQNNYKHNL
ncbi:uncharacterized protein LOC119400841 [Rhipicephalus sanguineus]|uniref:uncharacterized protein LOC119400841 n=1 Tax=Rhipicephalus sanguineus TaxID=34632 RepID=UPI0018954604|nr:uncharacterized protein LOC119400841 [Rhipicephalus sanguineus]